MPNKRALLKSAWVTNKKLTQADYSDLFDSILFIDEAGFNVATIDISYGELRTLVDGSNLNLNATYRITDFKTVHFISGLPTGGLANAYTSWNTTSTIEPLLVKPSSSSTLFREVKSELFPKDIIYFEVAPIDVDLSHLGKIIYRLDPINNVEAHYDWRNFKFARWETTIGSGVFNSPTNTGGAYQIFSTFNNPSFKNVKIKESYSSAPNYVPQANNIIFMGSCSNVIIEPNCNDMTFIGNVNNIQIDFNINNVIGTADLSNIKINNNFSLIIADPIGSTIIPVPAPVVTPLITDVTGTGTSWNNNIWTTSQGYWDGAKFVTSMPTQIILNSINTFPITNGQYLTLTYTGGTANITITYNGSTLKSLGNIPSGTSTLLDFDNSSTPCRINVISPDSSFAITKIQLSNVSI
jgi:hypothetical protein